MFTANFKVAAFIPHKAEVISALTDWQKASLALQ